ncbi:MAG: DUF4892 domain-containing protein [Candidatus Thiodiazotropha sp. (ex Ustalcina ferruginea)]|nr:DUF4892 domain-containing protein [Candidatus Thiodiazotropha sp. (ex Ustalcina ferruginea)]
MKLSIINAIGFIVFSIFPCLIVGAEGDVKGSKDHALVGRYAGSKIFEYNLKEFDEFRMISGLESSDEIRLEGKVIRIFYNVPNDRSTLEVMRNFRESLKSNNFKEIYSCSNNGCGKDSDNVRYFRKRILGEKGFNFVGDFHKDQRYLVAKLLRPAGNIYVAIYDFNDSNYDGHLMNISIVELKPMERDQIVVDSNEMASKISQHGSISLYGIYFDIDKAYMKPESKPTIDEIAKLLIQNPDLKLVVVGHTDNQGGFEYNMDLSKRRADSVKNKLVSQYNIEANRLASWGVAYLSPVSSNRTEEGRKNNRRVELVER